MRITTKLMSLTGAAAIALAFTTVTADAGPKCCPAPKAQVKAACPVDAKAQCPTPAAKACAKGAEAACPKPAGAKAACPMTGAADKAAAGVQTTCPVMGGKINKDLHVDVSGKRIYVCCQGCIAKIQADPDKYIAKLQAQGVKLEAAPAAE